MGWAWWIVGFVMVVFIIMLLLALAAAGPDISPEEEARLIWE